MLTKQAIDEIMEAVGVLQRHDVDTTSVTMWLTFHLPEIDDEHEPTAEKIFPRRPSETP